jgi:GntR family transcriptional regulator / MocR family aminotransferase
MLELPFRPDRASPEPVYRQLEAYLRGLVETGRLPAGAKLPASRELAGALRLARVTVVQAYEALRRDGLVRARVGQGTFVVPRASAPADAAPSRGGRSFVWSSLFALRARALGVPAGIALRHPEAIRFDLRGGQVDRETLPLVEVRRALELALRRHGALLAGHGDPYGWPTLRREIARLLVARGIECDADEVAVTSGAQQALDLAARVLLDPGDTVALEQPGYFGAALAFKAAQSNLVGVGVDEEGLRTEELEQVLRARRVKLVYATPAAQSPTGVAMSERRRRELLALADEHQTPILEDDYAAELRYEAVAVGALKAADRAGQVIYAGTFAKVVFPQLRLGFVVAPPELLRKIALARWSADGGAPLAAQMALASLIRSGALERHLRRVRRLYAERRAAMLESLRAAMPAGARWSPPAAGHSVWLRLPAGVDGEAVFRDALAAGIAYSRGDAFYVDGQGKDELSLSFATLPPAAIVAAVGELGSLVRRHASGGLQRLAGRQRPRRPQGDRHAPRRTARR